MAREGVMMVFDDRWQLPLDVVTRGAANPIEKEAGNG